MSSKFVFFSTMILYMIAGFLIFIPVIIGLLKK
jgi:hypothetical protein